MIDAQSAGSCSCVSGVEVLAPLLGALGEAVEPRLLAMLGTSPAEPLEPGDELALIDRELARLLAVRELYLAWVEELRAAGAPGITPAQFLRAWSDSTGRVIQLIRARRELGGAQADALLDAVYQELERRLPALAPGLPDSVGGTVAAPSGATEKEPQP